MSWVRRYHGVMEMVFVLLVIATAAYRRCEYLTQRPFWVDEAESSINALTILQHGVPVDRYLGLPIYENTLVKPWNGNPEYEFKDISYSDQGLAIYHGWIPLYSMAASFALFHIDPDRAGTNWMQRRTLAEFQRRTWVARLPSVFFSIVFLALCYWGGTSLLGRDAGLTALLVGCIHQTQIDVSTTARYYSATVTLSTAAVLCLWLLWKRGEWKHYLIAAAVFSLLFYTHLVTFAAGLFTLCILAVFLIWKDRFSILKLLAFAGVLALLTVPWIFLTGFLSGLGAVPPARQLLSFPGDFFQFPLCRAIYFVSFSTFLIAAALCWKQRYVSPPRRIGNPLHDCFPAALLLSIWIVCGYVTFMLFIPAASFFPERLALSYWGPALLLGSVFCAVLGRIAVQRRALFAAPLIAFFLLVLTGHDLRGEPSPDGGHRWYGVVAISDYLSRLTIPATTKLYASPNEHLTLTFYTGLPFQSIAPIRKRFLDKYQGPILYVERTPFTGAMLTDDDEMARDISDFVLTLPYRHEVSERILGVPDVTESTLPATAKAVIRRASFQERNRPADTSIPILRGYRIAHGQDWRDVFFYRFCNPASRSGQHTNYAERMRGARVDLLTSAGWAVYWSPFRRADTTRISFRVLP